MTTTSECAGADDARVGAFDRTRLVHVERDALGLLGGDVDDDDVGQFLVGDRPRDRRADVAGASYDRNFAIHAAPGSSLKAGAANSPA
jgi:hypothetical protein